MKTILLIIPTCAAMLFMTSCAAPFAPFPLSSVTSPGHYSSSARRYSSSSESSATGIDQTTLNAIDQNNLNNDAANVANTINSVQP